MLALSWPEPSVLSSCLPALFRLFSESFGAEISHAWRPFLCHPYWTTPHELAARAFSAYAELKQVAEGKGRAGQMKDPNRENWTPEDMAEWEAKDQAGGHKGEEQQQQENFNEANTSENGTEKKVSDFTAADIGSMVTVGGEPMRVGNVRVNEVTGDVDSVTLEAVTPEGKKRFGNRELEAWDSVYVEHEEPAAAEPVKLGDYADAIEEGLGKGDDLAAKVRAFAPYEDRLPDSDKADLRAAIEADANRRAENVISAGEWQKNHQTDMSPRAATLQRILDGHTLESLKALLNKWMPPDDVRLASSPEPNGIKPREIFYVGDTEVIRNPTYEDRYRMSQEVRSEFPSSQRRDDPTTRFTKDANGNTWIWKAHMGIHSQMEPAIGRREGSEVNQNQHFLASSPEPHNEASFKREKAAILATAPRGKDGHPLAHNGERLNLSEDQWATVRTGKFLKYFGDWVESLKSTVLRGNPVTTIRMGDIQARPGERASDAAYRWLKDNPQKNIERKGLGTVVFDAKSIEDTLGHGFSGPKLNALTAVRKVIENGAELDSSMSFDGKPLMNWIIAAPVEMEGDRHIMFVRVRHNEADPKSDKRFYVHEVVLQKWVKNEEASPFKTGSDPEVFRGKKSGGTGFYLSLARRALAVNPESVSKVVDENGAPMVVFNGTADNLGPIYKKGLFNPKIRTEEDKNNFGFYFATKRSQAERFYSKGGTIREVWLNVKNPLDLRELESFDGERIQEILDRAGVKYNFDGGEDMEVWMNLQHGDKKLAKAIEKAGYDGVVFNELIGSEDAPVWVAFESNQIKSATDNNGEFSENPSILRSSAEPGRGRPKSMVEFKKPFREGPAGIAVDVFPTTEPTRL